MNISQPTYRISHQGHKVKVSPERAALAQSMDSNGDGYVSNQEIAKFYGIGEDRPGSDRAGRINENKWALRAEPNPEAANYHSAEQVGEQLLQLQERFPDLCQRVCLGQSHEGRPIWGLRVTQDVSRATPEKTGVVITGCHHAREWMSVEVPLASATSLLEGYSQGDADCQRRLQKGEFWFVPVVNPDGLEHSREVDNLWRKNRVPTTTEVNGQQIHSFGVDPNRNYFIPSNPGLYRPDWDKPGVTQDDSEWGADDPTSHIFRGTQGGSEKEVQAMEHLKFDRLNVRGVLDYHSFGEEILYPYSFTHEAPPDVEIWRTIGEHMAQAAGGQVEVKSSADLYPISGGPLDVAYMHGVVGYEVELNGCFQPSAREIQPTCERYHQVNMVFADEILERAEKGQLPQRS